MAEPLQPGDPLTLGSCRLVGRLGQGGMGTVYLGQDATGRQVAVKVINPALAANPHFRDRFQREVNAARHVRPFCTAPVLDASLDGDLLYVVTEYVPGPTLDEAIANTGPLQGSDLAGLAVGVATALAAIHDTGIVHRDLKPSNVLLSGVGPRVIDFGISKATAESELTQYGQILGTPGYRAPEIVTGGPVTPASDVFSWACVVAFAGTGHSPSQEADRPGSSLPPLPDIDPELRALIHQALNQDPAERPSVSQLLQRLTGRADLPQTATPPPDSSPSQDGAPDDNRQRSSHRLTAPPGRTVAIAAVSAAALALIAWIAVPDTKSNRPLANSAPSPTATPQPSDHAPSQRSAAPPGAAPLQPTADPGDIDPRFLGRWTGVITDHGAKPVDFSALITINPGHLSEAIGESEYGSMSCHGTLTLVSATKVRLVVEERITKGFCKERVLITLTYQSSGTLHYEYKLVTITGTGTLRRA